MKKFFAFAVAAALCGVAVSCGGDDENTDGPETGGPTGPAGNPVVPVQSPSDFGGVRLLSVLDDQYGYGNHYTYDAQGLIKTVSDGYQTYTVDFAHGTVTMREYDEDFVGYITNTADGIITSLNSTVTEYDDNTVETTNITWNFQYDNQGHLLKALYEEHTMNAAGAETEWMKGSTTFTWSNGLLLSTYAAYTERYQGMNDSWSSSISFEYDDSYPNAFCQYTDEMISMIDLDGEIEPFMFVGVLGKGPGKFPSKIIDNDNNETSNVDYTLRPDGLVRSEILSYDYGYGVSSSSLTYTYTDDRNTQTLAAPTPKAPKKHLTFRKQRPTRR